MSEEAPIEILKFIDLPAEILEEVGSRLSFRWFSVYKKAFCLHDLPYTGRNYSKINLELWSLLQRERTEKVEDTCLSMIRHSSFFDPDAADLLYFAIKNLYFDVTRLLVKKGANIDVAQGKSTLSLTDSPEMVELLIESGVLCFSMI